MRELRCVPDQLAAAVRARGHFRRHSRQRAGGESEERRDGRSTPQSHAAGAAKPEAARGRPRSQLHVLGARELRRVATPHEASRATSQQPPPAVDARSQGAQPISHVHVPQQRARHSLFSQLDLTACPKASVTKIRTDASQRRFATAAHAMDPELNPRIPKRPGPAADQTTSSRSADQVSSACCCTCH